MKQMSAPLARYSFTLYLHVGPTVTPVAGRPPKSTSTGVPLKFDPLIVTVLPPPPGPVYGETPVTTGGSSYVYWSAGDVADVPTSVNNWTSTVPAFFEGGTGAVIVESSTTVTSLVYGVLLELTGPKLNEIMPGPLNPTPVTVTVLPPPSGP